MHNNLNMKSKFKISLLENGIHSLNKGLDTLSQYEKDEKNDEFKLKEAIMFLHHGIELILKQILINHGGEYLIFDNIGNDTIKKIIDAKNKGVSVFNLEKPIHTITYLDAIQRVKAFIDTVDLSKDALDTNLIELNKIRNNIEHYGIEAEKEKVDHLIFKIRNPISKFFTDAGINLGQENNDKWKDLEKILLIEASRLRGGGSIKKAELQNKTALIEYVANFEEYKELQPQSQVTQEHFESYWSSGDAVLKTIIDGGVRLMRKLDFINKVKITLPYKNSIYSIDLDKNEVEKFLGFNFEEIQNDWDNTFSDKFVYTREGREEFFHRFGKKDESKR
jgi:hypothetical protein